MKAVDLTGILKGFSSGWIAISSDYKKVVASGKTLKEITKKVRQKRTDDVILISAAKNYRGYELVAPSP